MSTWLVTGGAGYIGAHVVRDLLKQNFQVIVVDNLSTGLERKVPKEVKFYKCSVSDSKELTNIMQENKVSGVIHLAAKKAVGESVLNPSLYYQENIGGMISVLEAMNLSGVKKIVYSSSAAVYGTPKEDQVKEESNTNPESPYGETKLVGEWLLKADEKARGIKWISLRYFNVVCSGTNELGDTGINNLVPMVLAAITNNKNPQIFGEDYPTRDGTCVRDYIHVSDLSSAHIFAVQKLEDEKYCGLLNVGTGKEITVKEVIAMVAKVIKRPLEFEIVERRKGDPPQTVADVTKAKKDLGWMAKYELEEMIQSAWDAWQTFPPNN
jgi:UDP-glucose 4-epimerase